MPILSTAQKETPKEFQARRLKEKKHGRFLSKLKVMVKQYDGKYLLSRIKGYGIPLDLVEKEASELYDKVKSYAKAEEPKAQEAKAQEAKEEKAEETKEEKPEEPKKKKRGRKKKKTD